MIRGLSDYKKEDDKSKKKKSTNSYAGGEKSGIAVEHPDVEGVLAKAREKKRPEEGKQEEIKEKKDYKHKINITLYSNGFQVDDTPFRPYEGEVNQKFMKQLNDGHVPDEIRKPEHK